MDDLTGDYEVSVPPDNMAEKILGLFTQVKLKPQPGRPIAIDDGRLFGARDHLVWLFEETWADVGERLPWIKKPADVLDAIRVWDNPNSSTGNHYIAKTLLRTTSTPATPQWLSETRRQLDKLNEAIPSADETRRKRNESLETAQRALRPGLSDHDKAKVEDQINRRGQKLAEAESECASLQHQQQQAEALLLDGQAHFSRTEFVRFCRSNRYRLTPLNIANALAGLPYLGWRQSATRCKKTRAPGADGQSFQIFKTIERIVRSCTRRSDLVRHAEQWLRSQKGKNSLGIPELKKKWYYLRWSIKTVLETNPRVRTSELHFAITREYWKRIKSASDLDRLFEEEERIAN